MRFLMFLLAKYISRFSSKIWQQTWAKLLHLLAALRPNAVDVVLELPCRCTKGRRHELRTRPSFGEEREMDPPQARHRQGCDQKRKTRITASLKN